MTDEERAIYERFKREGYGDALPMLCQLVRRGQWTWKRLALLTEQQTAATRAREG